MDVHAGSASLRIENALDFHSFSYDNPIVPRRLPSLNALKAFEAAARNESFTRAADELCVTQGAVSQQVKALEVSLGISLFGRERQRLVITPAGREYLAVIRDALDRIAMGTERLVQGRGSGVLTVSTSPDFAAKWLVHRLGRFVESHPEIDLRVSATMHHVDFVREDVDIAVRHGDGKWPGLDARPDLQSRKHVDRCRRRWTGRSSRAHGAGGLGHAQWPPDQADRCLLTDAQHILDRLPEGRV
jgi:DNA-binding transcriptional LysR family regulator